MSMTREQAKRKAWEDWHGNMDPDDIPRMNIPWERGFNDGRDSIEPEVRSVLEQLDGLAEVWGDEGVFRRCRDRLRAIVGEP